MSNLINIVKITACSVDESIRFPEKFRRRHGLLVSFHMIKFYEIAFPFEKKWLEHAE